ncbi:hypothetical protein JTE90_027573 [Oedothorax gibbosus]|uniref:BHLH domain-containing protein n=1 Tax=Oedothorax gibbosus TaxID=931172 RepID=A0AAV6VME3_9ARAC|nr:hypothetical protein JTE90_027573 [Oedothorax gibbosus]
MISKPLIEKRRRARINRSLSQLVEIVAKPDKVQENRTARLEKASILEMTVEYLRKTRDFKKISEKTQPDDYENSFQEGYRLCMAEVQNFLDNHTNKKIPEEFLKKSLQHHLCLKLKSPTQKDTNQLPKESLPNTNITRKHQEIREPIPCSRVLFPKHGASVYSNMESCSSTSTEDEGASSVSESESNSCGEGKLFCENRKFIPVRRISGNEKDFNLIEGPVWRPW